jgi:PIN domain nuclease of toxin-antitoxin system
MVLWLAFDSERISPHLMSAMGQSREQGALSIAAITLWEIALLEARGRIKLTVPASLMLDRVERMYHVLPMSGAIALRGMLFSDRYPKDPADRQIGATAIAHGLTLVTADRKIIDSGEVACLA